MHIVIEHNKVKREMIGNGFNICGSREDLLRIADVIRMQMEREFSYGWVQIREKVDDEHFSGPNQNPLPWSESALKKDGLSYILAD